MRLFLAASNSKQYLAEELKESLYILESYYYFKSWQRPLLTSCRSFLLDSGAFTFMSSTKGEIPDWNRYIKGYIDFINLYEIDLFFELDIDAIVGYEQVKQMRKKIEAGTGKQCIPVWHRSRGAQEYIRLCDEYPYIAIGGFAIKDIKSNEYNQIIPLLDKAFAKGTKVHGLGFTPPELLKYPFYSVDSSSWTSGSRYASVYSFCNGRMTLARKRSNQRLINYKALDRHNLAQWLKYQKYLDKE